MNIKTNSTEKHGNFVDKTKKQNKYFKIIMNLFVVILCLFPFFVLFKRWIHTTTIL